MVETAGSDDALADTLHDDGPAFTSDNGADDSKMKCLNWSAA